MSKNGEKKPSNGAKFCNENVCLEGHCFPQCIVT